jgi:hypothetical protein
MRNGRTAEIVRIVGEVEVLVMLVTLDVGNGKVFWKDIN